MIIDDDVSAWRQYPHHRLWFNKLWLSEKLGYMCGPGGVPVPKEDYYIVRPIYNLRGMGVAATIEKLSPDNLHQVPPGYFWCEIFHGEHYSIDLEWHTEWKIISSFQGLNSKHKLYKFDKWIKKIITYSVPNILNELHDCKFINIEVIDNKIIEVHLRVSPDPNYNEIIPVWENEEIQLEKEYTFIKSEDDADGYLKQKRLGFFVK